MKLGMHKASWFPYDAELPTTSTPELPGILFRYENIRRQQQQPSQAFSLAACEVDFEFNFAGTSAVKACMFVVAGGVCSHMSEQ